MPILKPEKQRVKAGSSLHGGNEDGEPVAEESGQGLTNNMSVDTLMDPEDIAGGSTYTSVTAGKKKKVKAEAAPGGSDLNPGTTNVGTIDNDVDPADGYLDEEVTAGEEIEEEDDLDFEIDDGEEEIDASPELMNNQKPQELEASEDDDWDAPPPAAEPEIDEDDIEEDVDLDDDQGVAVEDLTDEPEEAASDEDVSILDLDETADDSVDDVAFATAGTRVLVIKANRVIATMTGRMAINAGRNDIYLSDQFHEVAASQIKASGLRRGLKAMGFALAKVSFASQKVLKAQVKKEVTKTTAAVRRVNADKEKAMAQSLAIAAVGINRRFFNEEPNELKAHLEGELRRLGIRGGNKLIAHAFAEYGPAYAKSINELAHKISAMPEEVRNGYVQALDMTTTDIDEPDEDMIPIGADDDDEFEDDVEMTPASVSAALSVPGRRVHQVSAAASGSLSLAANEVLNGARPLF